MIPDENPLHLRLQPRCPDPAAKLKVAIIQRGVKYQRAYNNAKYYISINNCRDRLPSGKTRLRGNSGGKPGFTPEVHNQYNLPSRFRPV
jgi:hypothetical protein